MFWSLVCFSTGSLCWGLYNNPFEMAMQSAVDCSEVKDGGLFVSATDGVRPGLGYILKSCCGRWFSFHFYWWEFWLLCRTYVIGVAPFPFPLFHADLLFHFLLISVCASIHWQTIQVDWVRVLTFSVTFLRLASGLPDVRACRADSDYEEDCFLGLLFPQSGGFCGIQQC